MHNPLYIDCVLRTVVLSLLNKTPLGMVKQLLCSRNIQAALCGGVLRDGVLAELDPSIQHRDIDIAVDAPLGVIEELFSSFISGITSFGGFRLQINGYKFDLWCLSRMPAFIKNGITPSFSNIPYIMDFNINALAMNLQTLDYYSGDGLFRKALSSKKIDINIPVSDSMRCLVRAIYLLGKFEHIGFTPGDRLLLYLYDNYVDDSKFAKEYCDYYGCIEDTVMKKHRVERMALDFSSGTVK